MFPSGAQPGAVDGRLVDGDAILPAPLVCMFCLTVQPGTLAGVLEEKEELCSKVVMELG